MASAGMTDFYRFSEVGFSGRLAEGLPYTRSLRAICMGSGGVTPRTWSGPGGSSHKRPLAGTRTYAGRFFGARFQPDGQLWGTEVPFMH